MSCCWSSFISRTEFPTRSTNGNWEDSADFPKLTGGKQKLKFESYVLMYSLWGFASKFSSQVMKVWCLIPHNLFCACMLLFIYLWLIDYDFISNFVLAITTSEVELLYYQHKFYFQHLNSITLFLSIPWCIRLMVHVSNTFRF